MENRYLNQRNPPRPKSGREEDLNKTCTIIQKNGTTTTVEGYGTSNACAVFIQSLKNNAKNLGIELVGNYLILNHKVK